MFKFIESMLRWSPTPEDQGRIVLTDESIGVLNITTGEKVELPWDDISQITIVTTDMGPFFEDVFFVFEGQGGLVLTVPHEEATNLKLIEALGKHLSPIDCEQIINAMTCTENNSFVIFKRQQAQTA